MLLGHGDDAYRYDVEIVANFSSNVSPFGTPAVLLSHLRTQLLRIANYPTPNAEGLTERIAAHHHCAASQVLPTNGATEAFYLLAQAFRQESAASHYVGIATPTFMEYESACHCHNISPRFFDRAEVLERDYHEDLVFICNPNNPDGHVINAGKLRALVAAHPQTVFVIDEAYIDFLSAPESLAAAVGSLDNLIVVKSLTKLFAIPGLRLGYVLASRAIIERLTRYKMPWSINALALAAGEFLFSQYEQLCPDVSSLLIQSRQFQAELASFDDVSLIPSPTNYCLAQLMPHLPSAAQLKHDLMTQHGMLIRDAENFRGLSAHHFRVATQSAEQDAQLLTALQSWLVRQQS